VVSRSNTFFGTQKRPAVAEARQTEKSASGGICSGALPVGVWIKVKTPSRACPPYARHSNDPQISAARTIQSKRPLSRRTLWHPGIKAPLGLASQKTFSAKLCVGFWILPLPTSGRAQGNGSCSNSACRHSIGGRRCRALAAVSDHEARRVSGLFIFTAAIVSPSRHTGGGGVWACGA
jgi:hypothetical protein